MKPEFELSQVIDRFKDAFKDQCTPLPEHLQVLTTLQQCRTSVLGGHIRACPSCGHIKVSYNSCRNRHCPKCQGFERERWIEARKEELLPVKYFHVVFTIPEALNKISLKHQRIVYSILFDSAWKTIKLFSNNLGVQTGMISLLHTWGSNLSYHPHLHCIVPAGGITEAEKWKSFPNANNKSPFLFPVKAMSRIFRAKFMAQLTAQESIKIPYATRKELFKQAWVVFSKLPFCGIEKVVEYIGRYSHRVAITNRRITMISDRDVSYQYKDYKDGGKLKNMTVSGVEFLRRFCLHILPKGFVRIRHYGYLAGSNREKLQKLQLEFKCPVCPKKRVKKKWEESYFERYGKSPLLCPSCESAELIIVEVLDTNKSPPSTQSGALIYPTIHISPA